MYSENRFKMPTRSNPDEAKRLAKLAQTDVDTRWQLYQALAARSINLLCLEGQIVNALY